MSNVISVVSAVTGREVASINTSETTFREAVQQALGFREISSAPVATRVQLETQLLNAFNAATDQEIRSELLRSVGIDHVKVSVGVTAEDAPSEVADSEPSGLDVVVNSAVLNAPVAEFNTGTETLDSLKAGAMEWPEVSNSSASTQLGLIATAREVLAATEGKTFANEHLSAVGIASVVVGDGGTAVAAPEAAPEVAVEETPIYAETVAAQAEPAPFKVETAKAEPVKFASEPKPIVKTVTKLRGLSNKAVTAIAVAAAVVGAVFGGTIF